MKSIGQAGDVEPETEAILFANDIKDEEFPQVALDELGIQLPWQLPAVS